MKRIILAVMLIACPGLLLAGIGTKDSVTFDQTATPSAPASGKNRIYFKNDDKLYKQTSAGAETEIGAGSVTSVTGTAPVTSSGGATPDIGFNWSSVSSVINSSAMNWTNINSLAPIQRGGVNWTSLSNDISNSSVNWASITGLKQDYGLTGLTTSSVNWVPRKFTLQIPVSGPNGITGKDKMVVFSNDSGYPITIDKIRAEASSSSNWTLFKLGVGSFNWTNLSGTSLNWDSITTIQNIVCSVPNNAPISGINWTSFATTSPTVATIENLTHIGVNWTAGSPDWATTKIEGHYN